MATQSINVLYVEDDPLARGWVRAALANEQSDIYLTEVASQQEFEKQLAAGRYDVVLSEFDTAGFEGLEVLDVVRTAAPLTPVIVLTQTGSTEIAVAAMKKGAADYIVKTSDRSRELPQAIRRAVEDGLRRHTQTQAETALKHNAARWESLVQNAPDFIAIVDRAGLLQFVNRFQPGFEPDSVIGTSNYDYIAPEYHQLVREKIDHVFETGQMAYYELQAQGPHGEPIWYETRVGPLLIDGNVAFVTLISSDITERKQSEQILQHYANRLKILREIDRAILAAQSVEEIAAATLERLAQLVPYTRSDVNLYNADEEMFENIAGHPPGQSKIRPGTRLPLAQTSLNIEAFRAGQYHHVEDYHTRPNIPAHLQAILATAETGATLVMPLIADGKLIGTVGLGRREPGAFSPEHIEILREVADSLAIAIQQTQLRAAEREQRLLAETLHEATLAVTSRTEFKAVLEEILEQVARIVPYKAANIALLEGDVLHTVAWRGYDKFGSAALMTHLKQPLAELPGHLPTLQNKEPRIIDDTRQDPTWWVLPETAWIRSHLLLPIVSRGEILGELRLDSDLPHDFSPDQARRLFSLAQTIAVALNNAGLVNQIQQYAAELEQRVAARTAELELTYRQQAALEERQRLARDLHDAVSQTLFSASLLAEAIPRLWTRYPEKARQSLDQLRHLNRGALAEMRILLAELRPASPDDADLAALLRQLTHALAGRTQIEIDLQLEGEAKIRADVQTVFYRIAQESLNNIARHARASRVKVGLVCWPEAARLTIIDDGRGFNPRQVKPGHLGLDIMRERARAVGARLAIKSRPGAGTEIVVSWPANPTSGR